MIDNIEKAYLAFLDGVKKEYAGEYPPAHFNRLFNEAMMLWYDRKAPLDDFTQDIIEDIQVMIIHTDGIFDYDGYIMHPLSPVGGTYGYNKFLLPDGTGIYPKYFRLRNVMFKLHIGNNHSIISDWIEAKAIKGNQADNIKNNPYRKADDDNLYFKYGNNQLILVTETASTAHYMYLEYLRYPREVVYDEGGSHIECEFGPMQVQEIVNDMIRMELDRIKDERYQTFNNEQLINNEINTNLKQK